MHAWDDHGRFETFRKKNICIVNKVLAYFFKLKTLSPVFRTDKLFKLSEFLNQTFLAIEFLKETS
jgi:hypothetical protein